MSKITILKENIEKMPKCHHIEVLRICKTHESIYINENNNGSFINLTEQRNEVIKELEKFVEYVNTQQENLDKVEDEKDRIQNVFFKDNKENLLLKQ